MSNFKELIKRYAGDRQICNCGNAYYSPIGDAIVEGKAVHDYPICEGGCGGAQITAREHIATCVLQELEKHNG